MPFPPPGLLTCCPLGAVLLHTQVKVKEHVTDGLENAGRAFIEVR